MIIRDKIRMEFEHYVLRQGSASGAFGRGVTQGETRRRFGATAKRKAHQTLFFFFQVFTAQKKQNKKHFLA